MKRIAVIVLLAAVALAMLLAGCGKNPVAKVNGMPVTQDEFYERLQAVDSGQGVSLGQQVLVSLLVEKMVEAKAKQKGIKSPEADIDRYFREVKGLAGARWDQELRRRGQLESDMRHELRMSLLLGAVVFPEKQIKAYWEQNPGKFDTPPLVTYRRVLLKSKAEAERVRRDLVAGRISFSDVVKNMSQDTATQARNGEVGPVPVNMAPGLEEALTKTPLNQLSQPIPIGYSSDQHLLIEVFKRTSAKRVPYAVARPRVLQSLMSERQDDVSAFMGELRSEAAITVYAPRYKGLEEEYSNLKNRQVPVIPSVPSASPTTKSPAPQSPE